MPEDDGLIPSSLHNEDGIVVRAPSDTSGTADQGSSGEGPWKTHTHLRMLVILSSTSRTQAPYLRFTKVCQN